MTFAMVDDEMVTTAIIEWLTTTLAPHNILVGDADAPAAATAPRFVEIMQLPDGEDPSGGDWGQPLAVRGLKFQTRAIGANRAQAQWVNQRLREAIFARVSTGYLNDIPVPKHTIMLRKLIADLGYISSGRAGGHLMHIRLRAHRSEV